MPFYLGLAFGTQTHYTTLMVNKPKEDVEETVDLIADQAKYALQHSDNEALVIKTLKTILALSSELRQSASKQQEIK